MEKFEALGIVLYRAVEPVDYWYYDAGEPGVDRSPDTFFHRLLERIAERNPDRFRYANGRLIPRRLPPVPSRSDAGGDDENAE